MLKEDYVEELKSMISHMAPLQTMIKNKTANYAFLDEIEKEATQTQSRLVFSVCGPFLFTYYFTSLQTIDPACLLL